MFTRLPNLRKLDLSENYMVAMDVEVLKPLTKLERIELESDYWRCTSEFMSVETWILSRKIVYRKQCKKMTSKMMDKMISAIPNDKEVDVTSIWNITNVNKNLTKSQEKKKTLTPFQKFDRDFPATQSFILGLEVGLAIGILGTYIWLRSLCKCGKLSCARPVTRRQAQRRQRMAESDMNTNLLWANITNPNLETPPPLRRQSSLPEVFYPLPNCGLQSITEVSELYDVIMPRRAETPPPPYDECRRQFARE